MKNTQVLLLENVDNLGIVGDVVKVKPGYARNYLLPHGIATVPTPRAVEALAERRKEMEAELARQRADQEKIIEALSSHEMTMERAANEQGVLFGGVSQHEIAEQLRADGFAVEDRWIRIGTQIKRLDTYMIPVVVDKELKTEVKLWVVSDRPLEQEDEDGEAEGEGDTETVEAAEDEASA